MSEFLNPKSMITPGIAGAVMMFLVNGVSVPFPELPQRWLALGLSLLIGALVVLKQTDIKLLARLGYWVLNSLVIFAVGFGSNNLARDAVSTQARPGPSAALALLVPRAYAQDPPGGAGGKKDQPRPPPPSDEARKLQVQIDALKAENTKLKAEAKKDEAATGGGSDTGFFKRW